MEYKNHCAKKDQIINYSCSVYFLIQGILCSAIFLSIPLHATRILTVFDYVILALFLILLDSFSFGFAYYGIAFTNMRFRVSEKGLEIKYPGMKWVLLSWNDVQQVCICNAIRRSRYGLAREVPVICIVKKGEVEGRHGRWKMYNLFHLYGVITIDYTDSFLSLITGNCPHSLIDLRHKAAYRLDK